MTSLLKNVIHKIVAPQHDILVGIHLMYSRLDWALAWYFMVIGNKNLSPTGSHNGAAVGAVSGAVE